MAKQPKPVEQAPAVKAGKGEKSQFILTSPVWKGSEKLPAGTVVTFDGDEPVGVYRGRCKLVCATVKADPADAQALASAVTRAEEAEAERDELKAKLEETEAQLAEATKPTEA